MKVQIEKKLIALVGLVVLGLGVIVVGGGDINGVIDAIVEIVNGG